MRKTKRAIGFFLSLIINVILNFEWSIPAWILLVCHIVFDISILCFFLAIAVWILVILFWMLVFRWASKCSYDRELPRENKNPYSSNSYNKYSD